jgi:hypothetical protein
MLWKRSLCNHGEVIPFDKLSYLFQQQMEGIRKLDTVLSSTSKITPPGKLGIGEKRGRMKIFFTEIRNGIFFAEATCTRRKAILPYRSMPSFGTSAVFMFKVRSIDGVELIEVANITNH